MTGASPQHSSPHTPALGRTMLRAAQFLLYSLHKLVVLSLPR
ncbi:hypothetical protein AS9A_3385 [Hoyosella subflava DQS3-9A1]|uniref:Uncharacterized protein n=1 Tax=Hoyosella subflava (strain DSM 45089 / JCM 17490 / NBRC 109087 / DQS3-9A1) TaxID=443218 RepID=F6EQ06_HOYSD|nr:hypothetical protein AS9A_3385 [Hoyosella subflava DQS3-9A1]